MCVSSSIEGCLRALGVDIYRALWRQYSENCRVPLHIYGVDKKEAGDVISPEVLFKNNLVPDALKTQEYWITKPVQFTKLATIALSDALYSIFNDSDENIYYQDAVDNYLKNNEYLYEELKYGRWIYEINDVEELSS